MDDNPIRRPVTTMLDRSVSAAEWLNNADQFGSAVLVARSLAVQWDELTEANSSDPDVLRQLHMRIIPNFAKALHALGLTPEGYARMTGVGGGKAAKGEEPPAEGGPFGTGPKSAAQELTDLINESDNVTQLRAPKT